MVTADQAMLWAHEQAVREGAKNKPKAPRGGKKKKKGQPENAIVKACLQYLRLLGCFVWQNKTGAWKPYSDSGQVIKYGKVGSGDILGLTPSGRFISCECKHGKNEQSDYQSEFQIDVERHNGIYILAYSVEDCEKRKGEILV